MEIFDTWYSDIFYITMAAPKIKISLYILQKNSMHTAQQVHNITHN